jgi:hypothetical protein
MQRFMGSMVNGERLENILDDHKSACVTVANCHIRKGTSPLRPRSAAATGLGDGMKKCLHQDCTHYRHTHQHISAHLRYGRFTQSAFAGHSQCWYCK